MENKQYAGEVIESIVVDDTVVAKIFFKSGKVLEIVYPYADSSYCEHYVSKEDYEKSGLKDN